MSRTEFSGTVLLCISLAACGSRIKGQMYHSNGGVVQVEFRSDGTASIVSGLISRTCGYSESRQIVSLVCNDGVINLVMQEDGALVGSAGGPIVRLIPVEK